MLEDHLVAHVMGYRVIPEYRYSRTMKSDILEQWGRNRNNPLSGLADLQASLPVPPFPLA